MDSNLESLFALWARPLSATEDQKCENAVGMVKKAIDASSALRGRSIRVFSQGSYRNNTNVRADSDVDIAVCCSDTVDLDFTFAPGLNKYSLGYSDATYTADQMRREVGEALRSYFGAAGVTEGNKAFDVHSNSYRVDADVVPCIEHRRYYDNDWYIVGTAIYPKSGGPTIVNWPEQHYAEGAAKNTATNLGFKRLVRIMKNIRGSLESEGMPEAKPISSYLIECLVYNVPNSGFGHSTFIQDVYHIMTYLYNQTANDTSCGQWLEVSELKCLFHPTQPWTRSVAHAYVSKAMDRLGIGR